jgi:benzoyl-CoA-dihydrodiol lyase
VRETTGYLRRTLARLDVSSRTLIALIEQGSCFAGTLAELAFCADRTYMMHLPDDEAAEPKLQLNALNFGTYPMTNDQGRLARRFYEETAPLAAAQATIGSAIGAKQAALLGLVTESPDDIDYADEVRMVIESRLTHSRAWKRTCALRAKKT